MALLSIEERAQYFRELGLGEYNEANIRALQKKYFKSKDVDGKYGTDTDNLLRHIYNVDKYTTNFAPEEFKCECGGKYCTGYPTYMKSIQLINLQDIRTHYGKPMKITSGMRCKKYNSVIGGSIANSKHLTGQATDFYMAGVTDTLANRKASIKWMKKLPNTTYIYGNGINSNGAYIKAPYMGNALHYDTGGTTPTPKPEVKKLTVDGVGGPATVRAAQTYFKCSVVDGYISGQNKLLNKYYPSLTAVLYGKGGSECVRAIQKWAGTSTDGVWGEGTSKAVQKKLGVNADGIFGVKSMKAFQTFLNNQLFPEKINLTPATTTTPTKTVEKKTVWKGIDVSDWQDKIDWVKVKNDGIDCAIIRYADGDTLDKRFKENMKGAIAAGLHVGCYIFSRAKTKAQAEKEAERLFNAAKPYATDMPLYIDLEVNGLRSYADTVASAFLNKMKALGGRGGVYANLNWWENYLKKTAVNYSASPFWIAQYNDKITHKNPKLFGIWQYSSKGSVSGIKGKVDMDKVYVEYWKNSPEGNLEKPFQETPVVTPVTTSSKYTGELPTNKLKKTTAQVIEDALIFGKWICGDNRFGYGRKGGKKYKGTKEYGITHSGGCHFCGTNASKIKRAKKAGLKNPEEWEYTYVCNTFVHACYAHAGVAAMLKASNHAWWIPEYQKSKDWKTVKKPSKITDLHPGDVLARDDHFCMYIGNGKGMEATSGTGGDASASKELWAKSIRICDFEKHFKATKYVFRYVGTVNSTTPIRYGEVSDRVTLLQKYLKWKGYDLTADKIFGDATHDAVKKYQKANGLKDDGIVGPATLAKMAEDK